MQHHPQLRRGHVYRIRICLPEFVNTCLGILSTNPASPSSSPPYSIGIPKASYRPCVLVSCTQPASSSNSRGEGVTVCQIALLATFGDTPLDELASPLLQHFAIPLDQLGPRYGLGTKDVNKAVSSCPSSSSAAANATRSDIRHHNSKSGNSGNNSVHHGLPGHLPNSKAIITPNENSSSSATHEYVVACIGSIRSEELSPWIDPVKKSSINFSESAIRRLEVYASERRETWFQIQSISSPSPQLMMNHHHHPAYGPSPSLATAISTRVFGATAAPALALMAPGTGSHIYSQPQAIPLVVPDIWQSQSHPSTLGSRKEKSRLDFTNPTL